jgi:hypothetical protein
MEDLDPEEARAIIDPASQAVAIIRTAANVNCSSIISDAILSRLVRKKIQACRLLERAFVEPHLCPEEIAWNITTLAGPGYASLTSALAR